MARHQQPLSREDILLIVLALFVPPITVVIKRGFKHKEFWIDLFLLFLFHLPAVIYAIYIVAKYPDPPAHRQGYERVDGEPRIGIVEVEEGPGPSEGVPPSYSVLGSQSYADHDNKVQGRY